MEVQLLHKKKLEQKQFENELRQSRSRESRSALSLAMSVGSPVPLGRNFGRDLSIDKFPSSNSMSFLSPARRSAPFSQTRDQRQSQSSSQGHVLLPPDEHVDVDDELPELSGLHRGPSSPGTPVTQINNNEGDAVSDVSSHAARSSSGSKRRRLIADCAPVDDLFDEQVSQFVSSRK